jgi:transketolase
MRKEFAKHIEKLAVENEKIIFLTGDLGFMALENVKAAIGPRFINMGVSEQNMISMAASLASENLIPVCYSIAPFLVFRPAEQIRIDICLHNLNVKLVGNGGGFGYGIMGATHHAIEDIAVISSFQNMKCFVPYCNEDVESAMDNMFAYNGPSYLRLGFGVRPEFIPNEKSSPFRKLLSGDKLTIIGTGPIILNAAEALKKGGDNNIADLFVISEVPLLYLPQEIKESLRKTEKLIVLEEHVKRGGLGENISSLILEENISCKYLPLYIKGYLNGKYGSRDYHLELNNLNPGYIFEVINKMINE